MLERTTNSASKGIGVDGCPLPADVLYPSIDDGLEGMRFIDACVRSSKRNAAWIDMAG